jgi:hypothetical protein
MFSKSISKTPNITSQQETLQLKPNNIIAPVYVKPNHVPFYYLFLFILSKLPAAQTTQRQMLKMNNELGRM